MAHGKNFLEDLSFKLIKTARIAEGGYQLGANEVSSQIILSEFFDSIQKDLNEYAQLCEIEARNGGAE